MSPSSNPNSPSCDSNVLGPIPGTTQGSMVGSMTGGSKGSTFFSEWNENSKAGSKCRRSISSVFDVTLGPEESTQSLAFQGAIRVVNLPQGHVVGAFKGHTQGESVEGLAFMDILGLAGPKPNGEAPSSTKGLLLASCATDGKAIVWDVTSGSARCEVTDEDVITSVTPHPAPNRHLFTTASADRKLKTWDARQGQLVVGHNGHVGTVLDSCVGRAARGWGLDQGEREADKGGSVVMSAGDDGGVLCGGCRFQVGSGQFAYDYCIGS